MATLGYVIRDGDGFKGQLQTVTLNPGVSIEIVPNDRKEKPKQPDYRVMAGKVEVGAGWNRIAEVSGNEYVSLGLAAPEFGPRRLYANLGRVPGADGEERYNLIWNPID